MFTSKPCPRSSLLSVVALLMVVALTLPGCAQKKYALAGFGTASSNPKSSLFSGEVDDGDTSFQVGVGLSFTKTIAVEAAYVDLGETGFDGTWTIPGGFPETDVGTIKRKGIKASGVFGWPVAPKVSLFARAGICRWDADEDEVYAGYPESHSASGTDPVFGVGVGFNATDRIGIRGEWERYMDVGEEGVTGVDDVDTITASVLFRF